MSLIKKCNYCDATISLREMPHGRFVAFDHKSNSPHKCHKRRGKNKSPFSPLTNTSSAPNISGYDSKIHSLETAARARELAIELCRTEEVRTRELKLKRKSEKNKQRRREREAHEFAEECRKKLESDGVYLPYETEEKRGKSSTDRKDMLIGTAVLVLLLILLIVVVKIATSPNDF